MKNSNEKFKGKIQMKNSKEKFNRIQWKNSQSVFGRFLEILILSLKAYKIPFQTLLFNH